MVTKGNALIFLLHVAVAKVLNCQNISSIELDIHHIIPDFD
jgi:hypothetical protein